MEIIIIRHQKVCMEWKSKYNSQEYNKACRLYDVSPIISKTIKNIDVSDFDVYTSELARTQDTAKVLFGNIGFKQTKLLNEVPLTAFTDTSAEYPAWFWNIMGRLQWYFNNGRQIESRRDTQKRAIHTIIFLEQNTEKAYCITHGFYMITFLKELKKRGYKAEKRKISCFTNMEMIRMTK